MAIGPFFDFSNIQRAESFDNEVLKGLNTYRNWGTFTAPIAKIEVSEKPEEDRALPNTSVKSLFNPVYSVGVNQGLQLRQNSPLLDTPGIRAILREKKDCSIKGLVEASQKDMLGRAVYSYADFMYCKELGKVSNNYLITLRRFPFPCGDHINYSSPLDTSVENSTELHNPDIGRLVTWLGVSGNEMSKILSWTVKMPFEELKSGIQDAGDAGGDKGGPLGTFLNATTNSKYRDQMVKGYGGTATYGYMEKITRSAGTGIIAKGRNTLADIYANGNKAPYAGNMGYEDKNKHYGPVDVLIDTHKRGTGLVFNHSFELSFDYELRSYDGINGKAAFLDLLGNILAVTYTNGAFWGGAYRGTGASQSNVFANLPIYKLDGNSSFSDVVSSFVDSGKSILSSLGGNTGNPLESIQNIISTIAKGAFSALLGAGLNVMGRPEKHGVASLLSPMPVGFWHVTIGNPWNPIMTIGNLIMEDATIEQYGPLGLDDFPTGIRVKCKLKHGKSRDATQIEHMFMQGETRIYTPVDSEVLKMYEAADPVVAAQMSQLRKDKQDAVDRYKKMKEEGKKAGKSPEMIEKDAANAVDMMKYVKTKTTITKDEKGKEIKTEDVYFDEESFATAEKDTQLMQTMDRINRHFFQWFGTNDKEVITTVAQEAAFGSKQSGKSFTGMRSHA